MDDNARSEPSTSDLPSADPSMSVPATDEEEDIRTGVLADEGDR